MNNIAPADKNSRGTNLRGEEQRQFWDPPNILQLSSDVCRHHMFFHIVMQLPTLNKDCKIYTRVNMRQTTYLRLYISYLFPKTLENSFPTTPRSFTIFNHLHIYTDFITIIHIGTMHRFCVQEICRDLDAPDWSQSGTFWMILLENLMTLTACYQSCVI